MKKLNLKEVKKQLSKVQLIEKLAKKNLKGGGDDKCPPPFEQSFFLILTLKKDSNTNGTI